MATLAKYLENLLIEVRATDPAFQNDLLKLPIIPNLDDPPSLDRVEIAVLSLKDSKATRPDIIHAEVITHSGCALHGRLNNLILAC